MPFYPSHAQVLVVGEMVQRNSGISSVEQTVQSHPNNQNQNQPGQPESTEWSMEVVAHVGTWQLDSFQVPCCCVMVIVVLVLVLVVVCVRRK